MIKEREKQNSKVMVALALVSLSLYINKNLHNINIFPIVMYFIIIGTNIYMYFLKNEILKVCLKYLALITASISAIFLFSYTAPYLYASTVYSILVPSYKSKKIFISVNIAAFIIPAILISLPISNTYQFFDSLKENLLPFMSVILGVTAINIKKRGKITVTKLNEELTIQNKKLQEYAKSIEDITILNERNRVAQELHDSLGHYLMAISMHLDILDKISQDDNKSKQVLDKTKQLTKDSIAELRKTVFELKEMQNSHILSDSIKTLTENLSTFDNIEFDIDIDKKIETFSPFLKDIIYKTIKESLTNGLKHGNATTFVIKINVTSQIVFSIKNNGSASDEIIKSNGLKGIEERLSLARGNAKFISNDGFLVSCTIPIPKEGAHD